MRRGKLVGPGCRSCVFHCGVLLSYVRRGGNFRKAAGALVFTVDYSLRLRFPVISEIRLLISYITSTFQVKNMEVAVWVWAESKIVLRIKFVIGMVTGIVLC